MVIFNPAPAAATPTQKNSISTPIIVLIAVVAAVAVIAVVAVALSFHPTIVNQNQTGPSNQTNINKLSFNPQQGNAYIAVLSQNSDKTGFVPVFEALPPN